MIVVPGGSAMVGVRTFNETPAGKVKLISSSAKDPWMSEGRPGLSTARKENDVIDLSDDNLGSSFSQEEKTIIPAIRQRHEMNVFMI